MIGDQFGALAASRGGDLSGSSSVQSSYGDCYSRAETAPDRAAGYSDMTVLVLGEGSERLSGDQWSAIRQWVMGGGSLIMIGGAASLPRLEAGAAAEELCRLTDMHEEDAASVRLQLGRATAPFSDEALVAGKPKAGATVSLRDGSTPLVTKWAFRAGTVSLVAQRTILLARRSTTCTRK